MYREENGLDMKRIGYGDICTIASHQKPRRADASHALRHRSRWAVCFNSGCFIRACRLIQELTKNTPYKRYWGGMPTIFKRSFLRTSVKSLAATHHTPKALDTSSYPISREQQMLSHHLINNRIRVHVCYREYMTPMGIMCLFNQSFTTAQYFSRL